MTTKRLMLIVAGMAMASVVVSAQYKDNAEPVHASSDTTFLTLDQALEIALSENVSVKVADKDIEKAGYAKKGTYASLFPQVDASGNFQRTIKKQVMYMDFDMSSLFPGDSTGTSLPGGGDSGKSSGGGIEVGRWNTWSAALTATMPIVNVQLWKSIKLSGQDVELAVEKARSSRLDMVTQVKQAFYSVLLAKEAFNVYKSVYENAVDNFKQTEMRYNAQKASELEYTRAKATVANAIPNVYNAESSIILALWQLKAVMGVDLDESIDVAGLLDDYSDNMTYDMSISDSLSMDYNTTMRQLAIQAEELATNIRIQKAAYLPTLSVAYSYQYYAMENSFKFSQYHWTPYSYVGISLNIPIFSGGKRLNQVRQAKVQAAQLDLQMRETERQLKIGIRQYLTTMQTNLKSYVAAQDAVQTAQKAYDISAESYKVGRSTITDLNDAQLALTQSRLAVSQAVYNFEVAKAHLEQIIGHDFIDEEGNVDLENR
ncbi:MAG: TolC family protein [Bacteroidales bacterium]|nr:TolC family protein [Bacteroidales bacterium]MDY6002199.1 TolC family protein [Candidatus Cryptobacteroides sp.]